MVDCGTEGGPLFLLFFFEGNSLSCGSMCLISNLRAACVLLKLFKLR